MQLQAGQPVNVRQSRGDRTTSRLDDNPQWRIAAADLAIGAALLSVAGILSGRIRVSARAAGSPLRPWCSRSSPCETARIPGGAYGSRTSIERARHRRAPTRSRAPSRRSATTAWRCFSRRSPIWRHCGTGGRLADHLVESLKNPARVVVGELSRSPRNTGCAKGPEGNPRPPPAKPRGKRSPVLFQPAREDQP
jgi:hypothetical protein